MMACRGMHAWEKEKIKRCLQKSNIEEILKDRRVHKGCQTLRTNTVCECMFISVLKSQIDTVCSNQIIRSS